MVERCGGLTGLIAGKPAPTGFRVFIGLMFTEGLCGSWLASDGVGTASILGN
jgi:hypothetical protein